MKKVLVYLLLISLVFSLLTGCKKKDEESNIDLSQAMEENQSEGVEDNAGDEKEEETIKEIEYILYLRYKDKPFLYDELLSIDINDEKMKNKSIEEFVLNELLSYQKKGDIISPIPEGTKVLSVKRKDKNVLVNLSKEFTEKKMTSSDANLAIGGIVNTMVAIPGNETAQILVEGKVLESYNGVKISGPLYFMEGLFPDK